MFDDQSALSNHRPWRRLAFCLLLQPLALLVLEGSSSAYACPQRPPPAPSEDYEGFHGRIFELEGESLPYRYFVPENYDPSTAYPLVLYLHHAGLAGSDANNETGLDNCVQLTSEAGSGGYGGVFLHESQTLEGELFNVQEKYPHILVAPHASSSRFGFGGGNAGSINQPEHPTRRLVYGILEQIRSEYNVDAQRIYVTGISMGCYGTWDMIMRDPGYFAAASPQSCRGDPNPDFLARVADMPIWSMCGSDDSYVDGARAMAEVMSQLGATGFQYLEMPGVGHSIIDRGYDLPGFIDWMFAQSLSRERAEGPSASPRGAGAAPAADLGAAPVAPDLPELGPRASGGGCSLPVRGAAFGAPSLSLLAAVLLGCLRRARRHVLLREVKDSRRLSTRGRQKMRRFP